MCDHPLVKLGELIETFRTSLSKNGRPLPYEELARRAREQGHYITRATIHGFATEETPLQSTLKRSTIAALAAALGVTEQTVVLAAVESMGIRLKGIDSVTIPPHTVALLTLTEGRSESQVRRLVQIAREVIAAIDDETPAPPPESSSGTDDDLQEP